MDERLEKIKEIERQRDALAKERDAIRKEIDDILGINIRSVEYIDLLRVIDCQSSQNHKKAL